ncbi:hypothetical protein ABH922_002926 [Rhodococcus sp. 27YEA15]|uniref:acyl-CoA carboxylase subunit epsilon n=1 Tax=Rhodococcus sp. 27YEA15 TaxID=3156259 RepID=UPI003C7B5BB9
MTATTEDVRVDDVPPAESALGDSAAVADESVTEAAPAETSDAPIIRIVKGSPTDVEIAALVSVLAAATGGEAAPESGLPAETWGDPTQFHRTRAPFSPYAYPLLGRR